jgi:nitronate monooxygenase
VPGGAPVHPGSVHGGVTADARDRLGIEHAVLQAALGGALSRAELAGTVSAAGGLGTVGMASAALYRGEIRGTRERANGRPFAANLLFPVARREHVEICIAERVPVVSLFFGFDARVVTALHQAGSLVLHQIGTAAQARRALADGADGLIVQGAGAGGHVLATAALSRIGPEILDLAGGRPVFAAGGIHDRASAAAARALGASGVSAGTRFLLTHESHAHGAYKDRLLAAESSFETLLFGVGWPARHRVVGNAATARWCQDDPLGPGWVRAVNRMTATLGRVLPDRVQGRALRAQRIERPFFTPTPLTREMDARLVDVTPLYAGAAVGRIDHLAAAGETVRELSE